MSKFSLNMYYYKSILACNVEFLDFLDIILSHIDSTILTDPLSKVERTRSSEIITLTFLLILPHVISSVISPGHIHDCNGPSHEKFFFPFAQRALCARQRALGDLPLPFAILSHLSAGRLE